LGAVSHHRVAVEWSLADGDFLGRRYTRTHRLHFEGGLAIDGTASSHLVPPPYSRSDAVDPEAAFTASLSACHMLWFLDHAAAAGVIVTSYRDEAEGVLSRNSAGRMAMTKVVLRPAASFAGDHQPGRADVERLHRLAHDACFIANSVKTEVIVEVREVLSATA
jgi:organic hydroperoxide reductase OsmC/OhrA